MQLVLYMDVIGIDGITAERVARVVKKRAGELPRVNVYDEKFYPPRGDDPERVLRFFTVMVALDHRVSRPGKQYYACLEDGCYKGADLLYRLGLKKYLENPEFFSPEKLAEVKVEEVKNTFSLGEASLPDPEVRTMLLRDLGYKLVKFYGSSLVNLLNQSHGRVRGTLSEPGLVDNLRVFRAYEDPVEKKAMLLAKFLVARGLFNPLDELDVAVDNHLSRVAYRLGLVMVSGELWDKIKRGLEVSPEEDVLLRLVVRRAYRQVAKRAGVTPALLDDYFWIMGRSVCLRDNPPLCEKCLFKGFCRAKRNPVFMVQEHVYYDTWYY